MYFAKYELDNGCIVQQNILKFNILDSKKNIKIYNFCLNELLNLNKNLYQNLTYRVSILNGKMELLLFFTSKDEFRCIDDIKEKFYNQFSSDNCIVSTPMNRIVFDKTSEIMVLSNVHRLSNSSYFINDKQIGIDFNIGSFVEKMIEISVKRKWNFSYQFQLNPYSKMEKKELERYAKKYLLKIQDEVYMPNTLNTKLSMIVDNIKVSDFFIDEIFILDEENREFYEMVLSDEFALKLSEYGFKELALETDELAIDLMQTGLSRLLIENVIEIEKIFSSISLNSLQKFLLKEPLNIIKEHFNNISKPYDIFISYSTVNTIESQKVCYELEKDGYKCWYAPRDILPSQQYPEQIIKGIKESKYFILLHSKDSTVSRYVVREVTKALSLKKIIIPILLDNSILSENMEFLLETCQWIDASQNDFDEKVEELKNVLKKV